MKNLLKRIRQLEQRAPLQPAVRTEEDSPLLDARFILLQAPACGPISQERVSKGKIHRPN